MASDTLKVALLIVSTTAAKDPSTDSSAAALSEVLDREGGGKWKLVDTKIVSDVVTQIQWQVMLWADVAAEEINLILTTGGTGFATADNTPEVSEYIFVFFYCIFSYWTKTGTFSSYKYISLNSTQGYIGVTS